MNLRYRGVHGAEGCNAKFRKLAINAKPADSQFRRARRFFHNSEEGSSVLALEDSPIVERVELGLAGAAQHAGEGGKLFGGGASLAWRSPSGGA